VFHLQLLPTKNCAHWAKTEWEWIASVFLGICRFPSFDHDNLIEQISTEFKTSHSLIHFENFVRGCQIK
jgi:hypothetical protein